MGGSTLVPDKETLCFIALFHDPSVQSVSTLAEGDMGDRSLTERGQTPLSTSGRRLAPF